jgi:hypothetical protein
MTILLRLYALAAICAVWTWRNRAYILLAVAIALVSVALTTRCETIVNDKTVTANYTYYLPSVMRPSGLIGKGVASWSGGKYQRELDADWFYIWAWCDAPGCVPMSRGWALPPKCSDLLLVGNEPNSIEPYGATTSPESAAMASWAIRAQCPATWLIAGNVALPEFWGMTGIEWIRRYIAAGGEYDQLGLHAYVSPNGNAQQAITYLEDAVTAFPGERMCVTETGTFNNSAETFAELLSYVEMNFGCLGIYTDRDPSGTVYSTGMSLVDADGALTEYGYIFAGR